MLKIKEEGKMLIKKFSQGMITEIENNKAIELTP